MSSSPRFRALAAIICVSASGLWSAAAMALPEDPNVVAGEASFQHPDNQTLAITASANSIVEFSRYNIGPTESVIYTLPDAQAATLSRVTGGDPSNILGKLSVNGTLLLVNTAGIVIGQSAVVNVGGLIASALPISNADFLASTYRFDASNNSALGTVANAGTIQTANGGVAALIGGAVRNTGTIIAPVGHVALTAGQVVTVGISGDNQVAIAINEPVAKRVVDVNGAPITAQIVQSGTIAADGGYVQLTAKAARGLFDLAINQDGMIRATATRVGAHGVIELVADGDVAIGGATLASGGSVFISAGRNLTVAAATKTAGTTTLTAANDLMVNADLATDAGNLTFQADADRNGYGAFLQAPGTTISTITSGDIAIAASGVSTLGNILSAGSLTLQSSGAAVTYTQWAGATVTTAGSLILEPGVTLKASTATYEVGKDWVNHGAFLPDLSSVWLVGPSPATIGGETIFYNFGTTVPGKPVNFEAGKLQEFLGTTTIRGDFGRLIPIRSTIPGRPFSLAPHGTIILASVDFQDAWIRGPPLPPLLSKNSGNNLGLDFSQAGPIWTGAGGDTFWSNALNWDGGFVPGAFDVVRFNAASASAIVDPSFSGTVGGLTLDVSYLNTVTLARNLSVLGSVTLAGGTLAADNQTLTVGGNWTLAGGTFQAGTSTVVFADASQPSVILGNNTFYNFTAVAPAKVLRFEAGATQTIVGTWTIRGAYAQFVQLVSTVPGQQWQVDPQGPRDLSFAWVEDSVNVNPVEIVAIESTDRGNSVNWDPTRTWTNSGGTGLWSTAANWSGGVKPGAGDDVVFDATSNTASTVDAAFAGTIKSLSLNAGYTNTVTLGRALTVKNTTTIASGTLNTSGSNFALTTDNLTISGGTLTANSSTITLTGTSGTLFTRSSGTFNAGTSTVVINGDKSLTLTSGSFTGANAFYNLQLSPTINANRTYTLGSGGGGAPVEVMNNFDINPTNGATKTLAVQLGAPLTVGGTTTITKTGGSAAASLDTNGIFSWSFSTGVLNVAAGGVFIANGGTTTLTGSSGTLFTLDPSGTFNKGASTVVAQPGGDVILNSGTINFSNLTIAAGANTVTLGANITLFPHLTVNSGTLNLSTFTANGNGVGTLSVASGATLQMGGSAGGQAGSNFPSSFATVSLASTSTVEYNAAGGTNQTIYATPTYGNLTLSRNGGAGTTTKTAGGALTLNGDLTINANAILDLNGYNVDAVGALTNAGQIETSVGDLTISAAGITIGLMTNTAGSGKVSLTANAGSILNTIGATNKITADDLVLSATDGIGSSDALETSVASLTATNTSSGNIKITNTGDLTINGISNTNGDVILENHSSTTIYDVYIDNRALGARGLLKITTDGYTDIERSTNTYSLETYNTNVAITNNGAGADTYIYDVSIDNRNGSGNGTFTVNTHGYTDIETSWNDYNYFYDTNIDITNNSTNDTYLYYLNADNTSGGQLGTVKLTTNGYTDAELNNMYGADFEVNNNGPGATTYVYDLYMDNTGFARGLLKITTNGYTDIEASSNNYSLETYNTNVEITNNGVGEDTYIYDVYIDNRSGAGNGTFTVNTNGYTDVYSVETYVSDVDMTNNSTSDITYYYSVSADNTLGSQQGLIKLSSNSVTYIYALTAYRADIQINNSSDSDTDLSGGISTSDGTITLTLNSLAVNSLVKSDTGDIVIQNYTAGKTIGLGDSATGDLMIDSPEISNLTPGPGKKISIGSNTAGQIEVGTANFGTYNVELMTGKALVDVPGATLTAAHLTVQAVNGIGDAANPLNMAVDTLDAQTSGNGAGIFIEEADDIGLNLVTAGPADSRGDVN